MGKHDHASCEHDVAWCRHCDTIYCKAKGCSMEWKRPCTQPHYFWTYPLYQGVKQPLNPWWGTLNYNTSLTSQAAALDTAPTLQAEASALACNHHGGASDGGG